MPVSKIRRGGLLKGRRSTSHSRRARGSRPTEQRRAPRRRRKKGSQNSTAITDAPAPRADQCL
jgi:hypothetical protein